jgi:hypothetical protein
LLTSNNEPWIMLNVNSYVLNYFQKSNEKGPYKILQQWTLQIGHQVPTIQSQNHAQKMVQAWMHNRMAENGRNYNLYESKQDFFKWFKWKQLLFLKMLIF